MNLALERAEFFIQDFELQAGWYVREASVEVARRYLQGLDATLQLLRVQPGLGRTRHFRHPQLKGIRSFRVGQPFNRHLISYRFDRSTLYAERVIHGMRDLPRRLLEPPDASA
ncbi:MAG: type II toxin-antitoxin system RelE/ParE family toxin [Verrucomicrobiota bacterium]